MKAVVYTEYGSPDVLQLKKVETPTPKDNEVRVKIYATSVNFGDLMVRNMKAVTTRTFNMPAPLLLPTKMTFGFNKPRVNILGAEFSGVIDAVGNDVTRFKVGDEVFGYVGTKMGANAEYLCVAEDSMLTIKPANMPFEAAATVPYGAVMAVPILRKANIQPGQKVLVNGASGAIGSYALQLAKYLGAEVTAVCGTPRMEMVQALGADHVIDYTQDDFTQNGETYDVIFDILGKTSFAHVKDSLEPNGIYLLASFKLPHLFQMLWTRITGSSKQVICALSPEDVDDLVYIRELIEADEIKTSIDRCYPLAQTAAAHRYIESDKKTGHVVISVRSNHADQA